MQSTKLLDVALLVSRREHLFLARKTNAYKKARFVLQIDEDDIAAECALALWKASLSEKSKHDPERSSISNYVTMVCGQTIAKMIRKLEGAPGAANTKQPHAFTTTLPVAKFNRLSLESSTDIAQDPAALREQLIEKLGASRLDQPTKAIVLALLNEEAVSTRQFQEQKRKAKDWIRKQLTE